MLRLSRPQLGSRCAVRRRSLVPRDEAQCTQPGDDPANHGRDLRNANCLFVVSATQFREAILDKLDHLAAVELVLFDGLGR